MGTGLARRPGLTPYRLTGLITLRADLHVHTLLSPCADVEMIPQLIVETAVDQGIGLIAITDHNASANIEAVQKAARATESDRLARDGITNRRGSPRFVFFDTLDQIGAFQSIVDHSLPDLFNNIDFFGEQFVVDETGDFIRREERLLLTSSSMTIHEAWSQVQ